eukprot:6816014-Prymnesium_polylepis.1
MRRMHYSSTDTSSGHTPASRGGVGEHDWDKWYEGVEANHPNWDPNAHRDASGEPQTIRQWVTAHGGPRA